MPKIHSSKIHIGLDGSQNLEKMEPLFSTITRLFWDDDGNLKHRVALAMLIVVVVKSDWNVALN